MSGFRLRLPILQKEKWLVISRDSHNSSGFLVLVNEEEGLCNVQLTIGSPLLSRSVGWTSRAAVFAVRLRYVVYDYAETKDVAPTCKDIIR